MYGTVLAKERKIPTVDYLIQTVFEETDAPLLSWARISKNASDAVKGYFNENFSTFMTGKKDGTPEKMGAEQFIKAYLDSKITHDIRDNAVLLRIWKETVRWSYEVNKDFNPEIGENFIGIEDEEGLVIPIPKGKLIFANGIVYYDLADGFLFEVRGEANLFSPLDVVGAGYIKYNDGEWTLCFRLKKMAA